MIIHIDIDNYGSADVGQFYCPNSENLVDVECFQVSQDKWNVMKVPAYGIVSACGTGTEGFLNIARQPVSFEAKFQNGELQRVIQINAILISQLMTLERVNLFDLIERERGGFEMVYFNRQKFEKLDDFV